MVVSQGRFIENELFFISTPQIHWLQQESQINKVRVEIDLRGTSTDQCGIKSSVKSTAAITKFAIISPPKLQCKQEISCLVSKSTLPRRINE